MRYTIATIQPKSGRLSLLCSEYKKVIGQLCRNYAEEINLKMNICVRRKLTKQELQ